jgi:hypothetical protein
MKYLLICCLLISCNVVKTLTGGETDPSEEFYEGGYHCNSSSTTSTNNCGCDSSDFNSSCFYETLHEDLAMFFKMEEASGIRNDSFGGVILAENYSAGNTSGMIGQAIDCNSASPAGHVLSGTYSLNRNSSDDFSIAFWAYKSENSSGGCADNEYVISFGSTNSYVMFDNISCSGGLSDIEVYLNGNTYQFIDVVNFPGFSHFVLNISSGGSAIDLYIDGNFSEQQTNTGVAVSTSTVEVCSDSGGAKKLVGAIDSLGVWNRLLSTDEISRLYNGQNYLD